MNSSNSQESQDRIADVLGHVRNKGVRLWSDNGRLRYKSTKGALTEEEIDRLRASKDQILALLERPADAELSGRTLEPRRQSDRVPLGFSQLWHWYMFQLSKRPAIRQIASATRLCGRLDVAAFRKSVVEVVRRHDALRTRIVVFDGIPTQEIDESTGCELKVDDLTSLPASCRDAQIQPLIEQHILEPIDFARGPLFGARLLKLSDNDHVLIVAMDHMISDAFSMSVLLRDLFDAYVHSLKGRAFFLPTVAVQFADYALWQRNSQTWWVKEHGAYWNERIARCQLARFPVDNWLPTAGHSGLEAVPFNIGKGLKAELREWCRLTRTTLAMSVFAAYVGLVLRWCNVSETVIQYQTTGRVSQKVENAIGYFASLLCLRIKILDDDSFIDLMNRVTEEYCRAHEHADFSYMALQVTRLEFARNTIFNWIPQRPLIDASGLDGSEHALTSCPLPFTNPALKNVEWDNDPEVVLFDTADEIVGHVHFPSSRFSNDTMERFGRNFLIFIRALLRQPEDRVKDILLVR